MVNNSKYRHFGTEADGMAAERHCENAVLAFTAAFDMGDGDAMAAQFADDGVWKRQDGNIAGAAQLRRFMRERAPGLLVRHALSNLRTTFSAAGEALVESYVTVYRHAADAAPAGPVPLHGPHLVGRYRDTLRLQDGQWRLAAREVQVDFKQGEQQ